MISEMPRADDQATHARSRPDARAQTRGSQGRTAALLGFLPLFALFLVVGDLLVGNAGWAFREAFLGAAQAVLDGESPYPIGVEDPASSAGSATSTRPCSRS